MNNYTNYIRPCKIIELSLLAGLIKNADNLPKVNTIISKTDFKYPEHQLIFDVILLTKSQPQRRSHIFTQLKFLNVNIYVLCFLEQALSTNIIANALTIRKKALNSRKKTAASTDEIEAIELELKKLEPGYDIPIFNIDIIRTFRNDKKLLLSANEIANKLAPLISKYFKYNFTNKLWSCYQYEHWNPIKRTTVIDKVREIVLANAEDINMETWYNHFKIKQIVNNLETREDPINYKKLAQRKWQKSTIKRDGHYAVITCNNVTVTLYNNQVKAKALKNYLDDGGCCDNCKSFDHTLINMRKK